MITANQARNITSQATNVETYLKEIESFIIRAAENGLASYFYVSNTVKKLETDIIIHRLRLLGYKVHSETHAYETIFLISWK